MKNKQPFYHNMPILFTATADLSDVANALPFLKKLARFLKQELGKEVISTSVEMDGVCEADAGDPADLM